jgi:class 3 adenylate cyclase
MLELSVRNDLIELLCANFTNKELIELGRLLFKNYNAHSQLGVKSHITLTARKHAEFLVDRCESEKQTAAFIKLLVELDDRIILGKHVTIKGIEFFLHHLMQQGFTYDHRSRQILDCTSDKQELVNWGSLRDGKIYDIAVMSIDIVGNSALVKKYGMRKMETFYYQLWAFLKEKLARYDGRLWSWAGDGGICAFTFKSHVSRAVLFAVELQSSIPVFNMRPGKPVQEDIQIRIGIDCGKIRFFCSTGQIVSDAVNYAAHLEKKSTEPGKIGISEKVFKQMDKSTCAVFTEAGTFEDRTFYITYRRLDDLFLNRPSTVSGKKTGAKRSRPA